MRGHDLRPEKLGQVLVIDHRIPTPDRDCGSLRMVEIMRRISQAGHHVVLAPDNTTMLTPYLHDLQSKGIEVVMPPHYRSVEHYLEQHGRDFDLAIISRADVAEKHMATVRRLAPEARIVFDTVDLHFMREQRQAALAPPTARDDSAALRKEQELRLARAADLTLVVSPVEKAVLEKACDNQVDVRIVPTIYPLTTVDPPGWQGRRDIVFIGGFAHVPNVDAVLYFSREIFPLIQARIPDAVFKVVGPDPTPEINELASPFIQIMGFVPDVKPIFDQARVSVAPIRFGAGVKGKVNQSMSFGVPTVVTSIAAEGMYLTDGDSAMIADEPESFADAVIALWTSPDLWLKVSKNGLRSLSDHFSIQAAAKPIDQLLEWAGLHAPARFRRRATAMSERSLRPDASPHSQGTRLSTRTRIRRRPSQIFRKIAPKAARTTRWENPALIAGFLIAISLPLVGLLFSLDQGFVLEENRVLSSRPELKLDRKSLAAYPAKLEAYFNDSFGFRKRLIAWLSFTKVAALGVSSSPNVVLGQSGWLYYGDLDIPYYRAMQPLTDAQLRSWQRVLEDRQEWLADRGIPYLVVFAPLKSTVYPEFMPAAYNRIRTISRLDQLMAHLKAHSNLAVLDLRQPILDEKARHQVYYRTDTHWNNRGAYVGYTQIVKTLARWFPQLEPLPIAAFEESFFSEPGRDLALLLGVRNYFWDRYVDLKSVRPARAHPVEPAPLAGKLPTLGPDIVYEQPDEQLPSAVMFRDSFANWLIPLLSENFSRIRYSWQYSFDREIVLRERPDVVVQEMVERALMNSSGRF